MYSASVCARPRSSVTRMTRQIVSSSQSAILTSTGGKCTFGCGGGGGLLGVTRPLRTGDEAAERCLCGGGDCCCVGLGVVEGEGADDEADDDSFARRLARTCSHGLGWYKTSGGAIWGGTVSGSSAICRFLEELLSRAVMGGGQAGDTSIERATEVHSAHSEQPHVE